MSYIEGYRDNLLLDGVCIIARDDLPQAKFAQVVHLLLLLALLSIATAYRGKL